MADLQPYIAQPVEAAAPAHGPVDLYGLQAPPPPPDVRDVLAVLWSRWPLFLGTLLLCLVLGVVAIVKQKPVYQATAELLVETDKLVSPRRADDYQTLSEMLTAGTARSVETQVRVVQSSPILEEALRSLGRPADRKTLAELKERNLKVESAIDSDVIAVSVMSGSPRQAADLANAIGDTYIKRSQSANRESAKGAKHFLEEQLTQRKRQLAAAEDHLKRYKASVGIASVPEETTVRMDRLSKAQNALAEADTQAKSVAAQLHTLRGELSGTEATVLASTISAANPLVTEARKQIATLESERAALLKEYQPNTPEVKTLNDRIAEARQQLSKELRRPMVADQRTVARNPARTELLQQAADLKAQHMAQVARVASLGPLVASARQAVDQLPAKERTIVALSRDVSNLERAYTDLNTKHEEMSLREQAQLPSARLVEPADVPLVPVKPKVRIVLAVSALLGLMLATALTFFMDHLQDRLKSPQDTERRLGLATLGVIPEAGDVKGPIMVGPGDRTHVAESFRLLQERVCFANPDHPLRSVLVTSPGPGEGKTTTALNLATTLAASGLRVILVDGDLRQPALADALRLSPRPGLTNVVREGVPLEEALQDSPVPNLRVLVPGPLPPNPPDFLNSQACRRVLRRLGEMADFVVIDSVPSSLLSDGLVIANEVDGVLLVARWGRTSRESLRRVVARLQTTRAKALGLCVNGMRTSGRGYGYQDYYRHYRSYGLRKELGSEGPRLAEVEPPLVDPPAEPRHASHESASLT